MNTVIELIIPVMTLIALSGTGVILYLTYKAIKEYTEQTKVLAQATNETNILKVIEMHINAYNFRHDSVYKDLQTQYDEARLPTEIANISLELELAMIDRKTIMEDIRKRLNNEVKLLDKVSSNCIKGKDLFSGTKFGKR